MAGGGKGGGSVPSVDPSALIQQQADVNRFNQYGPTGSMTWGTIGQNGQFTPNTGQSAVQINESPFQQWYRQGSEDLAGTLLENAAPRIQNLASGPLDTSNLPALQGSIDFSQVGGVPDPRAGMGGAPGLVSQLDTGGVQGIPQAGGGLSGLPALSSQIDFNRIDAVPSSNDFSADATRVEQATFDRAMNLLNPQFEQQNNQMQTSLANRGLPIGSEIYGDATSLLAQQQNDARTNAALDAVGAGRAEQSRLFNQAMQARGAQMGDQLTQIGLNNQARAQGFGEQAQTFGQGLAANQQGMQNALAQAGLANQARQQFFGEQGQLFGQDMAARNQQIQDQLTQLGVGNAARTQGLSEQQSIRNQEMMEIANMLGLQGVQPTGFQNFFSPSPVDVTGPYQLAQNAAAANQAANQSGWNSFMGGLFGLGNAAMFAFA